MAEFPPLKLSDNAIQEALGGLPGWSVDNGQLTRTFEFDSYLKGITFVSAVAMVAEDMDHHPDLHVTWRKVVVSVSTHSMGGLSTLDVAFARRVLGLASSAQ